MEIMYQIGRMLPALLFGWVLCMSQGSVTPEPDYPASGELRLTVVYNNVPHKQGLQTGWGFSCLVEGLEQTVLFDTGGDGETLLHNMTDLGIDVNEVDAVVLSHIHDDHTGGLAAFLSRNPDVTVYVPESFPEPFVTTVRRMGATVRTVAGPRELAEGVHTTGEMGSDVKEQALILETRDGLVVMTGCAHPNVATMTERAADYLGGEILLVMGGFHLRSSSDAEIQGIIGRLRALGVAKVAPSHCTGDNAMRLFQDEWGEAYVASGLGAVIEVAR